MKQLREILGYLPRRRGRLAVGLAGGSGLAGLPGGDAGAGSQRGAPPEPRLRRGIQRLPPPHPQVLEKKLS